MFNATITGRLGSDPEMRYTDGGTPVANVSIAHNWLHRDERLVKWIRCSIWGELAEKAMNSGIELEKVLGLAILEDIGRSKFEENMPDLLDKYDKVMTKEFSKIMEDA